MTSTFSSSTEIENSMQNGVKNTVDLAGEPHG